MNKFKTKTNLKINKPNRRDIFSTNYNIKLMHILKDIFYSKTLFSFQFGMTYVNMDQSIRV
jgi:hypothetical protein